MFEDIIITDDELANINILDNEDVFLSEPIESEPIESEQIESEQIESEQIESELIELEPIESEPLLRSEVTTFLESKDMNSFKESSILKFFSKMKSLII